jgi:hypothetical protein
MKKKTKSKKLTSYSDIFPVGLLYANDDAKDRSIKESVEEIKSMIGNGTAGHGHIGLGWGNTDVGEVGLKFDQGKQQWYGLPLEILKPLADVCTAGEKKYKTFNLLNPFEDSNRRFYDSLMRHLEACQIDPLAIDEETGCYHQAQVAFSALLRLRNALINKRREENEVKR